MAKGGKAKTEGYIETKGDKIEWFEDGVSYEIKLDPWTQEAKLETLTVYEDGTIVTTEEVVEYDTDAVSTEVDIVGATELWNDLSLMS
jgi:hypothetical protein